MSPGEREGIGRRFSAQDGLSLFYREWPGPTPGAATATPLLCLPGLSRNSRDFLQLGAREGRRRRVVAVDYRGRGRSDYPPDWRSYDPLVYLRDLGHLLAVAGLERFCVVGTSLGGFLAMGLGVISPMSLAGVVLNDAGPGISTGSLGRLVEHLGQDRPMPDLDAATADLQARLGETIGFREASTWRRFAEASYRIGEDGLLHLDWDTRIVEPLKRRRPLPDLWTLWRGLARIPTLALRGGSSPLLSAESFRAMAEEHHCLTRLEVEGLGHAPSLEEPEVLDALEVFLAELDRREGFADVS